MNEETQQVKAKGVGHGGRRAGAGRKPQGAESVNTRINIAVTQSVKRRLPPLRRLMKAEGKSADKAIAEFIEELADSYGVE